MKKRLSILMPVLAVLVLLFTGGLRTQAQARPDDTILEGVYAGSISLGGMTREEAFNTVSAYVESLGSSAVTLYAVNGNTVSVTA